MKFFLYSFTLLFAASEAATIRKTMVLPAAQECDPNKAEFRMASEMSRSCGPNSHCVINGNSSLGGYCHDNDSQTNLDMPEAMRGLCFVCESPDNAERNGSEVTKPDDIVGAFTCGELAKMGTDGDLPNGQCEVFQRMIIANDSCGCSGIPAVADVEPSVEEAPKPEDDASFDTNDVEKNFPGTLTEESSNPFDFEGSGSSSKAIAIAGDTSVVTVLLVF